MQFQLQFHYLYYLCPKHREVSLPGQKLHDQFNLILEHLSLRDEQIVYAAEEAEKKMKEMLEHKSTQLDAKTKELAEIEKSIDRLEKKMMDDVIESVTYKKWFAKYSEQKSDLLSEIQRLKNNTTDRWNRLKTKLDLLKRLPDLYEKVAITKKHLLLNKVFNRGLLYSDGVYRTPWLHPALSHNELIMNEKGLLFVKQPSDIWGQIPLSSP